VSTCVQLLAGIKFPENLIRAYFREDIMQESVIYQKIINEGVEKGKCVAREEGREERRQSEIKLVVIF
jgi:predicted transposase YdaD